MGLDKIPEKLRSKRFLGPEMLYDWFSLYYAIEFQVGAFEYGIILFGVYNVVFVFAQIFVRIV